MILLFGVFILTLMMGLPIAFCLGISSLAYLLFSGIPLEVIPQKMYSGMDSFVLLCIPGFILAGNLMNQGGISKRIIDFCNALIGHIRGGLALAAVVASMIFAGISGTAAADAASIGAIMIPSMIKAGYKDDFACALTSSASTVGPIIPPSVPMVIVGTLTGLSVGKLLVASAIPGIILGIALMITSYIISIKKNYPKGERSSFREIIKNFFSAFWAIIMPIIILGGIVGGFSTPTEASIIAAIYAFIVGTFIYKELNIKNIKKVLLESTINSASIIFLVGFANVFAWIMASEQIPQLIANFLLSISSNRYIILLIINILLLIVGMFMETIAALIILFPVLLKVVVPLGVDPIHLAVIVVLNLVIGLNTPPVGVCMFITTSIAKISVTKFTKAVIPFLLVSIAILMLVTYIPQTTLFLPNLLFNGR